MPTVADILADFMLIAQARKMNMRNNGQRFLNLRTAREWHKYYNAHTKGQA